MFARFGAPLAYPFAWERGDSLVFGWGEIGVMLMLQNAADYLPAIGWSLPLSVRDLQMRILKAFAICPDAAESADRIARQWLGGENVALVRATLEHLTGRGILFRRNDAGVEFYSLKKGEAKPEPAPIASAAAAPAPVSLKNAAMEAECDMILQALKKTNFNKSKAAALLNIDRKTLYNKMKHYNL